MPTTPDLVSQARNFAADVSDLLNRTIAQGISLTAVLNPGSGMCWVGRNITKHDFSIRGVPLTLGRAQPRGFLQVAFILQLDPERVHLAVAKSAFGLFVDDALDEMVFHYDYNRDPANEYPEAHFQVNGACAQMNALAARAGITKELKDYHFPVGGRRFRPTLEDVIEFLVVEGLADGRSGWDEAVAQHRKTWEERQLLAAVRRQEPLVREYLSSL